MLVLDASVVLGLVVSPFRPVQAQAAPWGAGKAVLDCCTGLPRPALSAVTHATVMPLPATPSTATLLAVQFAGTG